MARFVIHAPKYRERDGAKSFEAVLADGVGEAYAISQEYKNKLNPGCAVVLLRKDKAKRRAEGFLINLVSTSDKTPQGIQRYDVHIKNLKEVPYKPEKLNRFGVAVI